ncbi:calcium-binding protein [Paracoccus aestuariivivens]|nr:hypothetical protein [Paracoccus aestuariivivens]
MPYIPTGTSLEDDILTANGSDFHTTTFLYGLTYTIGMLGNSSGDGTLLDPYLLMTPPEGAVVYNDDAGIGLNALITYRAITTGTHSLEATSFDGGTGSYTISISAGLGTQNGDVVRGSQFADMVNGLGGNDQIAGLGGNDRISGASGNDTLGGGNGADTLLGGENSDVLIGNTGNDVLHGGNHNDVIYGGPGADILGGGFGADRFVFQLAEHSTAGSVDRIVASEGAIAMQGVGAVGGDVIDLQQIDANTTVSGNQAFVFTGGGFDSGQRSAGRVWLEEYGGRTLLRGNTDADAQAEISIWIEDGNVAWNRYYAGDFVL